MGQYCVDASVFITAWDVGYPINVLPSLWEKIAKSKDNIVLIKPIFDEINPISSSERKLSTTEKKEKYPLRMWLEENDFVETLIDSSIEAVSLELEREYKVSDVSKGAGPKDICLIAYAKTMNKTAVTFEAEQKHKPDKKNNYKIPLICKEQNVECITFIEMIRRLGIRI